MLHATDWGNIHKGVLWRKFGVQKTTKLMYQTNFGLLRGLFINHTGYSVKNSVTGLHESYLGVYVCGPCDPKSYFLSGFLMRRYRAPTLPPTPGRPSAVRAPVSSSSALASFPTWAAVHVTRPSSLFFHSVEPCSHWGDILLFANEML